MKNQLLDLQSKHSKQISLVLGEGLIQGITLKTNFKYVENIIKNIPISFIKNKKSLFSKLPYISLIDYLYINYQILTHITPNYEIFVISPSLIVKKEEIIYFINSLNKAFEKGLNSIIIDFVIRYLKK